MEQTELLIVGAGPFGLAMAAQAQTLGIDQRVVGEPMSFWRKHMPVGMVLRSGWDWHLDPTGRDSLEAFLATRGQVAAAVEPLSLALYLEYADWFQRRQGIVPRTADGRATRLVSRTAGRGARPAQCPLLGRGPAHAGALVGTAPAAPGDPGPPPYQR